MSISHKSPQEPAQLERLQHEQSLPQLAWLPVLAIAVAVTAVIAAYSGQYGYFRNELYYVAAGQHLAWGYPDMSPFVPLLARLMSGIAPGSLVVLRLPSTLSAGVMIVLTAMITRELRGGRAAQLVACAVMAVSPLITAFYALGTEDFDLLVSVLLCWLLIRILRTGEQRLWLVAGLATGAGLLDSSLVAFLVFGIVFGLFLGGPRWPLRSGWFYAGGVIALAIWCPYLAWQASHGWPQLLSAQAIEAGSSDTSTPWWSILSGQLSQVPIWLFPVPLVGLVQLLRDRGLRPYRAVGIAFLTLAVVFMAAHGKPYYLSVLLPALTAAGAQPTAAWIGRAQPRLRRGLFAIGLVASAAGALLYSMPVVPVSVLHKTPFTTSYGIRETIGWPTYVQEIAQVYDSLPATERSETAIVASNYGEAGAVDRFGPAYGLPAAYSPVDGFWYWGAPPASKTVAIVIGAQRSDLWFCGSVQIAATLNNHLDINNDEQGARVWICTGLTESWAAIWPKERYIG